MSIDDFEWGNSWGCGARSCQKKSVQLKRLDLNVRSDKAAVDIQLKNGEAYLNIGTKME